MVKTNVSLTLNLKTKLKNEKHGALGFSGKRTHVTTAHVGQ